jgi:hypothetical protein
MTFFKHTVRAANTGGTPVRDGKGHEVYKGENGFASSVFTFVFSSFSIKAWKIG